MASVSQLAKRANTSLQPDHVAFLAAHAKSLHRENGEAFPEWCGPGKAQPNVDEDAAWAPDVIEVFGSKKLEKLLSGQRYPFWDRALFRHAVPIAVCGTGDVVVQVVKGRSAGDVLLVSHDAYSEFFEQLARVASGKAERELRESGVGAVLRRHGYRGGEPSSDQVVAVLVHRQFDGAVRIARSFGDFYQQLYRGRLRDRGEDNEVGYKVTKVEWELHEIAGDRKRLFMIGHRGRRSFVLAMEPDGSPEVLAKAHGLTISRMLVHGKQLLHATTKGLRVSSGGAFRTLLRGDFIGIGHDGAGGVWAIAQSRTRKRQGPEYRYSFFHSKNGTRFRLTSDLELDSYLLVQGSCSKGLLLAALQEGTLYLVDRDGSIGELGTPRDEYFSVLPIIATRRGTLIAGDEWRSTDMGKTWKRPRSVSGISAEALLETSTGVVVILGKTGRDDTRLLISRDDGARFSALSVRIKGPSTGIAELGGSLVVANGEQLVRLPLP